MKLKHIVSLLSATLILNCAPARAEMPGADRFVFEPSVALFTANELSLDLFGYSASRDKGGGDHQAWGPGVAGNYYFTENFGVAAETYADAFEAPYLLNALGEFRYPIVELSLAPYVFAGAGREWTHTPQWLGHIGGGVEYRFNSRTGFFLDARRVLAANSPDYTLVRFGLRLAF